MHGILALLAHCPYAAVFGLLLACGLGAPLSEDLILVATGALVAQGVLPAAGGVAVALAGVLAGDLALFALGRRLGGRALDGRLGRRLLPPPKRARLTARLSRWGLLAVFGARFIAGARACTFFAAGTLGVPRRRFVLTDTLAAAIWVPAMVLLSSAGASLLRGPALHAVRTVALIALAGVLGVWLARKGAAAVAGRRPMEDAPS